MWMYGLCLKLRSTRGQAMSEYGLILAIVAVALIAAMIGFRNELIALFNSLTNTLLGTH